jgi:biotin carboxylase
MKRLLIIGASILQLPAIMKAKEMGFRVGVVDYSPGAIGISYADDYFDYSTIDADGILQAAYSFRPDGIMTLASDMPILPIAVVANKLGLPGLSVDSAIKATHKGEMMKAFKNHQIEAPWFYIINNPEEMVFLKSKITFPCIIKPCDNSGSRGVVMVENIMDLDAALQYSLKYTRGGSVIIEEFLSGNEVSVEAITADGVTHILAITDKITTGPPHFVEIGHSQPSKHSETDQIKIKDLAIRAIKSLGIINAPAHVEIMLTSTGPKMIELGARLGGDNITTHLVPLSTGIDMVRAAIQISVGQQPDIKQKFQKNSAILYIKGSPGIISEISGIDEAKKVPGIKEVVLTKKAGDHVSTIQSSNDRIGYVIAQGDSIRNAIIICEEAIQISKIKTENESN